MDAELRIALTEIKEEISGVKNELTDFKKEVRNEFADVRGELTDFKKEVRNEFAGVQSEFADVKSEFADVKSEFADVQSEFTNVRGELTSVESRLGKRIDSVEGEVKEIRLILENEIRPDIQKIADGYALLEDRMDRRDEEERQYRRSIDLRIGALVNQKAN